MKYSSKDNPTNVSTHSSSSFPLADVLVPLANALATTTLFNEHITGQCIVLALQLVTSSTQIEQHLQRCGPKVVEQPHFLLDGGPRRLERDQCARKDKIR